MIQLIFRFVRISAISISAITISANGQRVSDFTAALEQAKTSHSSIAVFLRGSDWNRPGEAAAKIWNDPRFLASLGGGVLLLEIDRKEKPSSAELELAKLNEKANPQAPSIPAVALFDHEGRLIGLHSGTSGIEAVGGLLPATKKLLATCRARDGFWNGANDVSGVARAERLGRGLDSMNIGLGPKSVYQPILEQMRKADPDDKSGYVAKYTFSSEKLVDHALAKAEKMEFDEADKEIAKWSGKTRLSAKQKQELQAARFALYQRWPLKKPELGRVLEKMRDIDPKSELGKAAATYLEMLAPKRGSAEPHSS
jgi:hypothetical protein